MRHESMENSLASLVEGVNYVDVKAKRPVEPDA